MKRKENQKSKPNSNTGSSLPNAESNIENYPASKMPVLIQKGDTGFALAKKNYRRFIWTMDDFSKKNSGAN